MTVFELAKKYYPRLWGRERIEVLMAAGRLTEEQGAELLSPPSGLEDKEGDGQEEEECLDMTAG